MIQYKVKTQISDELVRYSVMDNPKYYIKLELIRALSKNLLKDCKIPIPVSKDGMLEYDLRLWLSSDKDARQIIKDQKELKIWKELFGSHQDIIDRRINEDEIEYLKGL